MKRGRYFTPDGESLAISGGLAHFICKKLGVRELPLEIPPGFEDLVPDWVVRRTNEGREVIEVVSRERESRLFTQALDEFSKLLIDEILAELGPELESEPEDEVKPTVH